MLRFNDGVTIDTSGDLRPWNGPDGWYVIGEGRSIPCDSMAEARAIIAEAKAERARIEAAREAAVSRNSHFVHTAEPYRLTMETPTAFALLRILHRYVSDHPDGENADTARALAAALKHQHGGSL